MGLGSAMAGGNPAAGRQRDDFYPTPPEVTHALMQRWERGRDTATWPCPYLGGVWEPCAGDGAMGDVLRRYYPTIIQSDIEPRAGGIIQADFLVQTSRMRSYDTIITNPPFNLAPCIIEHAFGIGVTNMALVLKSTFWAAARRRALFEKHRPAYILQLTWRPDFLNKGAPTMDVMWCVWHGPCAQFTRYELLRAPNAENMRVSPRPFTGLPAAPGAILTRREPEILRSISQLALT